MSTNVEGAGRCDVEDAHLLSSFFTITAAWGDKPQQGLPRLIRADVREAAKQQMCYSLVSPIPTDAMVA